jgi:hypothetical protein
VPDLSLQMAVDDLYEKARRQGAATSAKRLQTLAAYCIQELEARGLRGAQPEPELPGFARNKDWDVAWFHNRKPRLAISLKSLLTNLGGTVPNRLDDLLGEVANLQMYSPEIVVGYLMVFNLEEDGVSAKHGCRWSELFQRRLSSITGRRAPHWTIGTLEAASVVAVDFTQGPRLVSGHDEVVRMLDVLAEQVYARNPDLTRPGGA